MGSDTNTVASASTAETSEDVATTVSNFIAANNISQDTVEKLLTLLEVLMLNGCATYSNTQKNPACRILFFVTGNFVPITQYHPSACVPVIASICASR